MRLYGFQSSKGPGGSLNFCKSLAQSVVPPRPQVLVYDDIEWVGYMSAATKETRTKLYIAWGLGGTTDYCRFTRLGSLRISSISASARYPPVAVHRPFFAYDVSKS
jgi:hypothetical protein